MAAKLEEITGIFLRERVRFGDVAIGEIELPAAAGDLFSAPSTTTIKGEWPAAIIDPATGKLPPDALLQHASYRFFGRWTSHPKHGRQFVIQTYVRCQPFGRAGVVRYLQQAPNIGQATAVALWNSFQSDAVRIVREQPDVAAAAVKASHFTEMKAREAAAYLETEKRLEACTIDLIDLLGGRGFPRSTAKSAIAAWGNMAATMIRRNPYLLMRFKGCGFLRCDQMYLQQGGKPNAIKRQALAAWYQLASDTEGHTWHVVQHAENGIRAKIASAELAFVAALKLAKRAKAIATRRDHTGRLWVADYKRAAAEERVAEYVAAAIEEGERDGEDWPLDVTLDSQLSEHQALTLGKATMGRIGILAGSPGTGKTYTAAALVKSIIAAHGESSVAICAPTGKAAVRVTEAMAGYGISKRASTIHSLLGVAQRRSADGNSGEGWAFTHNADNPLPQRFIVVDESSMIDTSLMASLLSARAVGSHVLFVGDPNQLPPVGHGAPLRDMIAANVPYGELREIRRNCGTIVRACAQIRDGKPFGVDGAIDLDSDPPRNLKVVDAAGPEQQIAKMLLAIECARKDGRDPVWDCQVIVPVNAKSQLSRKELNKILQRELNKTGVKAGSNPFLKGDKIVCLKNSFFPADELRNCDDVETNDDGKIFVANGELAEVVEVAEKLTTARLSSPERFIKIPRGNQGNGEEGGDENGGGGGEAAEENKSNTGCQWDLGYALSFHKSQGSDWPVVILIADEYAGARMLYSRELWYTGISRAKHLCLIIGKKATVDAACRRVALMKRKTFLKELIFERTVKPDQPRERPGTRVPYPPTAHLTGKDSEHANLS